ncbi:MAG: hypothetical protein AAFX09_13205 [Pseudomonadota bacterium]
MMNIRLISLAAAGGLASLGLAAGGASLAAGSIDQAIAFTWPSLGAALALVLAAPARGRD